MIGKFVTIEGPDGAGKTTQALNISQHLEKLGYDVLLIREPGGTEIGEKIRNILLDPQNSNMAFKTEVLLYAAARAQIIAEKIVPALDKGCIVICDRFLDSSIAYQGWGRNEDMDFVKQINSLTVGTCIPDLTILLDLDVEEGLKRIAENRDRLEGEKLEFHYRVRQGFLECAAENDRFKIVSAQDFQEIVFENMLKLIEEIL